MAMETQTSAHIKERNYSNIYQYIYQCGRTSKQTIAEALSLSLPTVSQNLKLLEEQGLIERKGHFESTGGRKAQVVQCIPDARLAIGVTVLKDSVQACVVNLAGQVVEESQTTLSFESSDEYCRKIGGIVNSLADGVEKDRILGVDIAIQGLVSPDGKAVIYGPILHNENMTSDMFQRYIPYHVRLVHDTEAAAYAEFWHNEDNHDAVYLVLNRNLGGALIMAGTVQNGDGVIEHITLYPDGKPCYCGKRGCAEAYCSADSLRMEAGIPLELFFQRMRSGDEHFKTIWNRYLENLALIIDNIRMLVKCNFLIGGLLQQFMIKEDFETLKSMISHKTAFPATIHTEISLSRYGYRASMLGAALRPIDTFLSTLQN